MELYVVFNKEGDRNFKAHSSIDDARKDRLARVGGKAVATKEECAKFDAVYLDHMWQYYKKFGNQYPQELQAILCEMFTNYDISEGIVDEFAKKLIWPQDGSDDDNWRIDP